MTGLTHQLRVPIEVSISHGEAHGVVPYDGVLSRVVPRRGVGAGGATCTKKGRRDGDGRGCVRLRNNRLEAAQLVPAATRFHEYKKPQDFVSATIG